jgi:hypothetical protein
MLTSRVMWSLEGLETGILSVASTSGLFCPESFVSIPRSRWLVIFFSINFAVLSIKLPFRL